MAILFKKTGADAVVAQILTLCKVSGCSVWSIIVVLRDRATRARRVSAAAEFQMKRLHQHSDFPFSMMA
jgi:hypothetical protein